MFGGAVCCFLGLSADQWKQLMSENGWNDVALRDSRYNQVIHMVSLAASEDKLSNGYFATHGAVDLSKARKQDTIVSQVTI